MNTRTASDTAIGEARAAAGTTGLSACAAGSLLGEWDAALAALGPEADPELRAEIAVDRWFFRVEGHEDAGKAVAALDPLSPAARLLAAWPACSRLLFQRDPRADDRAAAGYRAAASPERAELIRTFRPGAEELRIGRLRSEG